MSGKKKLEENGNQDRKLRDSAEDQLARRSDVSLKRPSKNPEGLIYELQVHQIELEMQNEELRRAQRDLEASQVQYFELYDLAPIGYFTLSEQGEILEANLMAANLLGVARSALVEQPLTRFILPEDQDIYSRHCKLLFETGAPQMCELRLVKKDGAQFWAWLEATAAQDADGRRVCRAVMSDITERRRAEDREWLAREALDLLNRSEVAEDTIHDILTAVKKTTGFDAVAIRLREGDDFPYYVNKGFPEDFVLAERLLCARDQAGEIVRDEQGNPVLECMCGNILYGRTNPALPFFTEGGSFWSNCTTRLLASTTETDRQARNRNRCNSAGYESVALIPLRAGGEIIGLLQLNDHRLNRVTLEMIHFFEGLGASIGIALARKQAEKRLRESEEKYRNLFENANESIFVTQEGKLVFLNPMTTMMLGYSREELMARPFVEFIHPNDRDKVVDRHFRGMKDDEIPYLYSFRIIHRDGNISWVELNAVLISWKGKAATLNFLSDITERKQTEQKLKDTLESLRKAVSATIRVMASAVEIRDPYTAGHQIGTANLARAIATEMRLPQEQIDGIRIAGSIHDIGKLALPAEILSKPAKLSEIEFSLIKEHSRIGYEILKDVESPWSLAEIVYQHHERRDGSGYPRNLKEEEICMEARILAVADVVESMASHRPYRASLGINAALEETEKNRGTLYDEAVVDACLRLFRDKGFQIESGGHGILEHSDGR